MNIKILDGYGLEGEHIFTAATTCYKSEAKTKRTTKDFIKMLKSSKHLAMLEFSWIVFDIQSNIRNIEYESRDLKDVEAQFRLNPYFKIFYRGSSLRVGGNLRAWYETLRNSDAADPLAKLIIIELYQGFPELFYTLELDMTQSYYNSDLRNAEQYYKIELVSSEVIRGEAYPDIRNKFGWIAVKFFGISRGFIAEVTRHRTMSFAVQSTRYVDNSNFDIIFPFELEPDLAEKVKKHMDSTQELYNELIQSGFKKQDARQLLPIGISQDMCMAGTIEDWKKVFVLRTPTSAHWEIRECMQKLEAMFEDTKLIT